MKFVSTRGGPAVSIDDALLAGLANDGGLYVPMQFPRLPLSAFDQAKSIDQVATCLLAPFFADSTLVDELPEICREVFDFPAPTKLTGRSDLRLLELFHGPTAAFKDFGARFLAACLKRLQAQATVLVATSGDTGGAVAAAFAGDQSLRVVVLYPKGMVSPRQEHQLTCWPDNIVSLRVNGDFDQCQALAKQAFADPELKQASLTSANSISIGRLLPQMSYYALASLQCLRERGKNANFVVPSGNLGNALACIWARRCGLPIDQIVLATNANRAIPVYVDSGRWQPRPTVCTLANAMDVGNPSNMERLRHLFPESEDLDNVRAFAADDIAIKKQICWADVELGEVVCPHTATALNAYQQLRDQNTDWIVVATAHAAKFEDTVEALVGRSVEVPPALAELLERPSKKVDIEPTLDSLRTWIMT
ncbi:MAG: threonine synthase [Lysobacteraceae bacterium]|nr:MAG: threonine synthase [Xanthomonadaceae bacterium]